MEGMMRSKFGCPEGHRLLRTTYNEEMKPALARKGAPEDGLV